MAITDGTGGAGLPVGTKVPLGSHTITVGREAAFLDDGTLAGSTLTMDQALRNLIALGLSIGDASRRVSTYAADHLGLGERGRLVEGSYADMVALDADLNLTRVIVEGEEVDLANA